MCDIGYLPGEISLPENLTGKQFIKMMSGLRGVTNETKTDYLIKKFKLDITGKLKRMSLGNKRKLALVTAFMHDPNVLVLDEPTSGLDPIMQHEFINFIKEEKAAGKTILLSSHIFSEVESLCDNVSIIKEGKIVSNFHIDDIKYRSLRTFKFEFFTQDD
jgi:ABC-2 type transport system ATP-binding protein